MLRISATIGWTVFVSVTGVKLNPQVKVISPDQGGLKDTHYVFCEVAKPKSDQRAVIVINNDTSVSFSAFCPGKNHINVYSDDPTSLDGKLSESLIPNEGWSFRIPDNVYLRKGMENACDAVVEDARKALNKITSQDATCPSCVGFSKPEAVFVDSLCELAHSKHSELTNQKEKGANESD